MSHIATVKIVIKDLAALQVVCTALGLELRQGQKTYRWYGSYVQGHRNELNPCEHAIARTDKAGCYEIGLVKNPEGEGYRLEYDNYDGLDAKVGPQATWLKQQYGIEVARKAAMRKGYRVVTQPAQDGKVRLVCSR